LTGRNPFTWLTRWVDWFEMRGVYVPGDEKGALDTWRDFGWLIVTWLVALGLFVLFFAIAS
jgi:hypothetical protein